MQFKSNTILAYQGWHDFERMKPKDVKFADDVYAVCERNYDAGGDLIVECFEPSTILNNFETLEDVKKYIAVRLDHDLNRRWGNDDDPELLRYQRFENANWEVSDE